jgi:hypothetical protein
LLSWHLGSIYRSVSTSSSCRQRGSTELSGPTTHSRGESLFELCTATKSFSKKSSDNTLWKVQSDRCMA